MTPEQQRIAIAKACGWQHPELGAILWIHSDGKRWADENHLPDYLNDLNAMHEAEKILSMGQFVQYEHYINKMDLSNNNYGYVVNVINATASQRAEALLRTIGKWVD